MQLIYHDKLGDAIWCTNYLLYNDITEGTLYSRVNRSTTTMSELMELYGLDPTKFTIEQKEIGKAGVNICNHLHNNKQLLKPIDIEPKQYHTEPYVSIQYGRRGITREKLDSYIRDRPVFDMSEAHKLGLSLKEVLAYQAGADEHIGLDSGTSWSALILEKPLTVLTNGRPWSGIKYYEMYPNSKVIK